MVTVESYVTSNSKPILGVPHHGVSCMRDGDFFYAFYEKWCTEATEMVVEPSTIVI